MYKYFFICIYVFFCGPTPILCTLYNPIYLFNWYIYIRHVKSVRQSNGTFSPTTSGRGSAVQAAPHRPAQESLVTMALKVWREIC